MCWQNSDIQRNKINTHIHNKVERCKKRLNTEKQNKGY